MNRCLVDKPLCNKYLVCRSTRSLVNFKNLVPMLLCLLFTLSTSNLFTRLLVYSSTLKPCSYVTLSFIYPVYKQLVHSSTRLLINFKNLVPMLLCLLFTLSTSNLFTRQLNMSTRLLVILSTFFKHLKSERWSFGFLKTPFWLAKGAL